MPDATTPTQRPRRHADERTVEVSCTRCRGVRWILIRPATALDPEAYICQRCRAVRAGRATIDPRVTEASRARTAGARHARNGSAQADLTDQEPRSPWGVPTDPAPRVLIGSDPA